MANALYDNGRNEFLSGNIDWVNNTIEVFLIDTADYTVDLTTDTVVGDIPSAARVAQATITSKTATDGIADAADTTFTAVTGDESEALVIYKYVDDGSGNLDETAAPLIAYIDNATNLPVTPNGGDIVVVWDDGTNKIFKL